MTTIIRAGSGLGDSLYLRAICEYLVRRGEDVCALSDYPNVFIGSGAAVETFRRHHVDVVAHYTTRKHTPGTTQFEDMVIGAGLPPARVPLRLTWDVRNQRLVDQIRTAARGRRVVLVHGGREPMGRTDGFGSELLPKAEVFAAVLDALADCFLVRIGKGTQLYPLRADMDLSDATSVSDLMDIGFAAADAAVGQCCFLIPLAEGFNKPLLTIWAAAGLASREPYIRSITPVKILSARAWSRFIVDDWDTDAVARVVAAFRDDVALKAAA